MGEGGVPSRGGSSSGVLIESSSPRHHVATSITGALQGRRFLSGVIKDLRCICLRHAGGVVRESAVFSTKAERVAGRV